MNVDVSIILATKNRAELLEEMFKSLQKAATRINYEVIVIDGNSTDNTLQVLKKYNVRKIFNEEEALGPGRHSWPQLYNFGFNQASGKWGMYASDDTIFDEHAFDNAVEFLNLCDDDVAGGAFFYKNALAEENWDQYGVDFTLGQNIFINYGLLRIDLFNEVNGLDEQYKFYCADGDLCLNLIKEGYKILPVPYSKVIHNNVLDVNKQINLSEAETDIKYYQEKWKKYFSVETSNPRRILLEQFMKQFGEELREVTNLIGKKNELKLHLGCGQKYLEGYVNIDYPPAEHTVQQNAKVDLYADITKLEYENNSVDEIRLHHVFEHFDRPTALALLCNWHKWLKVGGRLVIETPDLEDSINLLQSHTLDYNQKQAVMRHVFGSHEASWAVHYDGWYKEKYEHVLEKVFYKIIGIQKSEWLLTRNITVVAEKGREISEEELREAASEILAESKVDNCESEIILHETWLKNFDKVFMNQKKNKPVVSIFLPVYNGEKYIAETLESLLNQTYKDFEIIIADDGSTDNTVKIAKSYEEKDDRIKVIELNHAGEVKARNEALKHVSRNSKYLMNHDSDDISLPDKLEKLVHFLESNKNVSIVGCFAEYFDDDNNHKGSPHLESDPQRIKETFGKFNSMVNSTALIKKEVFEKIGNYREEFRSVDDYDFFARALKDGFQLANIPEVLHKIRLHENSIGSKRAETQKILAEKIRDEYLYDYSQDFINEINIVNERSKSSLDIIAAVHYYYPHVGGSELVVQKIAEGLVDKGHNVTVATSMADERDFETLNGVKVKQFHVGGNFAGGFLGNDVAAYQDFLAKSNNDILFNYAAQQWATDLAFPVVEFTKKNKVNIIAPCGYSALKNAEQVLYPEYKSYFEEIIPSVLPLYDAAIYHSKYYKDFEYARNLGLKNSYIIPNGIDEKEFENKPENNFREKYKITTKYFGLCVANFLEGKGHDSLISIFKKINRKDFTLVLIGKDGGQLNDLKTKAPELNIKFLEDINREDTVAAYHAADLFLFASKVEASPLVIIEAKASKTPFISTNVGNVKEWKGGIVCCENEIAEHVNILLNNDEQRFIMAEEGYNEWKEKLTLSAIVDRYENLFVSLYEKKQKSIKEKSKTVLGS